MNEYKTIKEITEEPVTNGLNYIYVIQNAPQNFIKIGISSNPKQRFQSLSGSNSGGNKIIRIFISDATYISKIEKILHSEFERYRIPHTEWFENLEFERVIKVIQNIFNEPMYNEINFKERLKFETKQKTS